VSVNAEATPVESDQIAAALAGSVEGVEGFDGAVTEQRGAPMWRRAVPAFAITAVVLVALVVAFAIGYDAIHASKVLPGVDVAGVQVGGLDRAAAEAQVRAALPSLSAGQLQVRVGDAVESISYSDIGRDYDMDAMLAQAFAIGRGGDIVEELRTLAHGASVPVSVTWDNAALINNINSIAARSEATPVNASVNRGGAHYVYTEAVEGSSVDRASAYRAAILAVGDPSLQNTTISMEQIAIPAAISTAQAKAAVDTVEGAVTGSLAFAAGSESLTIPSDVLRGWVRLTSTPGQADWKLSIDRAPIAQYVDDVAAKVDVAAVNASYTFEAGEATVVPSANGLQVDQDAATAAIVSELEARSGGAAPRTVNLSLATAAPEFTTVDAAALVSRIDRLGRWTTHFTVSSFNGDGVNIKTPAKLIDGTVVEPGAQFDFIDVAGPFTRRNGYSDGAAIENGHTRPDGVVGGGLCSASTTLFNAALRAGFQIDERHNHSFYISRYPVGLDATIWENGATRKSMRFTNDSPYPILIRGSYSRGRVTFEIWGVPDGRTVEFSTPRVEHEKEAENFVEYTDDLEPGVIEHVEYKATGFDSWVTRTVRDAQGVMIHEETYFSDYIKVDGVYKVGRFPGDPKDGIRIPADEYVPSGTPVPPPPPA
jgi:vancomycin resistance protein YoaR